MNSCLPRPLLSLLALLALALAAAKARAHDWNGLALAPDGALFTIDAEDGQIWRVSAAGEAQVFVPGEKARVMEHPHHLSFDEGGRLWLASG